MVTVRAEVVPALPVSTWGSSGQSTYLSFYYCKQCIVVFTHIIID